MYQLFCLHLMGTIISYILNRFLYLSIGNDKNLQLLDISKFKLYLVDATFVARTLTLVKKCNSLKFLLNNVIMCF